MARSAKQRLQDFGVQDLVNTAWAFAKVCHVDVQLFRTLAKSIGRRLGDFKTEHLARTASAFVTAGHLDAQLFTALARSAEQLWNNFNPQDLAMTAWAFAKAGQLDAKLFAALARSAARLMGDFSDDDIYKAAWAFEVAGQQDLAKRLQQQEKRNRAVALTSQWHPQSFVSLAPADVSKCGRIVIAGGGIAGSAVAVALQAKGFEVVVLETDASFDARKQGYALTILKSHK